MSVLDNNGLSYLWGRIKAMFAPISHTHSQYAKSVNNVASVSGNVSLGEANLNWGGKHIASGVSPVDAALYEEFSPNRLAYLAPDNIEIEYSTDGGSTWQDYPTSDTSKVGLVTTSAGYYIGNATKGNVNNLVRVTITANYANSLYFQARKAYIYINSQGASGCYCTVERAKIGSENTFSVLHSKIPISGWGGWNVIQLGYQFGGSDNQTSQYRKTRFTFGITSVNANTAYSSALNITKIRMVGETAWSAPSNFARNGHMYSYDNEQNVTFPAKVQTDNGFTGDLEGTASKATSDGDGNNIGGTYVKTVNGVKPTNGNVAVDTGTNIVISDTQPASQKVGDIWLSS